MNARGYRAQGKGQKANGLLFAVALCPLIFSWQREGKKGEKKE